MKFLALGDTHLGLLLGRSTRAKKEMAMYAYRQFSYCIDQAISNDVDYVFHTGDIFNRSKPPNWVLEHYYTCVERLLDHNIGLAIIPGNHDRGTLQPSLIDSLYEKYHVFNKLNFIDIDETRVIGLPFLYTNFHFTMNKIRKWVEDWEGPSVLLAHQLFKGATFGPHSFKFSAGEDVLDSSEFPQRCQIISGHIHRAQSLNQGKIVYTGSTIRTSFQEMIEPKGYIIGKINPDGVEMEFETIPTRDMYVLEVEPNFLLTKTMGDFLDSREPTDRILIRCIQSKTPSHLISRILKRYSPEQLPYLSITPRDGQRILAPLFTRYRQKFQEISVKRHWKAIPSMSSQNRVM